MKRIGKSSCCKRVVVSFYSHTPPQKSLSKPAERAEDDNATMDLVGHEWKKLVAPLLISTKDCIGQCWWQGWSVRAASTFYLISVEAAQSPRAPIRAGWSQGGRHPLFIRRPQSSSSHQLEGPRPRPMRDRRYEMAGRAPTARIVMLRKKSPFRAE